MITKAHSLQNHERVSCRCCLSLVGHLLPFRRSSRLRKNDAPGFQAAALRRVASPALLKGCECRIRITNYVHRKREPSTVLTATVASLRALYAH